MKGSQRKILFKLIPFATSAAEKKLLEIPVISVALNTLAGKGTW